MTARLPSLGLLAVLILAGTSCKDNPELVRQREEQRVEIKRLQGQLAVIEEKLKDVPPDRSKELAEAKAAAEAQAQEIAATEKEVASLEASKLKAEKEFNDYQLKYPLKRNN